MVLHDENHVGPLAAPIKQKVMSTEFSTAQMQAAGDENKDALRLVAYLEIMQTFMGKEKEDLSWMGMPLHPIQFVAIIQSAVAKKDPTYICPDHTNDYVFLKNLSQQDVQSRAQEIIVRNTSDQAPKISVEDLMLLDGYAIRHATREITLENVRILINAPSTVIEQMAAGIEDISRFQISPVLVAYVEQISSELYPINGLRHVPNAALLKLVTIRFGVHDVFPIEYFGHLLFRDPSTLKGKPISVHCAEKSIQVRRPGDHVWSEIIYMNDLSTAMVGLAGAARALLHPSILGSDEIMLLHGKFTELFDNTGGVASIPQMLAILKLRLFERASNLRQKAVGQEAEIKPLNMLLKGSQDAWNNLEDDAKASFRMLRNNIDRRYATGETSIGSKREVPEGLGPLGRPVKYQRKKEKATPFTPEEPENKKRDKIVCARCAEKGHISRGCKKPWAKVSKMPAAIQALAKRIRDDEKIGYEDGKPHKK